MKILFTVHGYKPAFKIGGPVISVSSLAEAITRKGHEVTVFTTNCNLDEDLDVPVNCPLDVDGVEVWYFKRYEALKDFLPFASYLTKSIGFLYSKELGIQLDSRVSDFDIVHTHLPFIYPTYAAARAAKKAMKPLFYHQRGVLDPARLNFRSLKKRLYLKFIEKPILRYATTLFALTQAEVKSYQALCPGAKCCVIPNGIDVEKYQVREGAEQILGFPADSTVILFLGRLHPIKGADRLIEAFISVCSEFPNSYLVMAGPDEFKIEAKFRERASEAGIINRIMFPGMVTGDEKKKLLARADLFCLPSDAEGFSMAVLEALASETAVMISPGCNFPEVEKAGCGIVAATDGENMRQKIRSLLGNDAMLREMGRSGRDFVARNYSWSGIADRVIEAYTEGIQRNNLIVRKA